MKSFIPVFLSLLTELGFSFSGVVFDLYTRQPVSHAVIEFSRGRLVYADSAGRFNLPPEGDTIIVTVSRVGYAPQQVRLVAGKETAVYLLPEVISLEGITVSAYRLPVRQSLSGPVTVIEGGELLPRGRTSVAEVLSFVPSTLVRDYANLATVSLRGASAEQTLVLFDGVPLNLAQDNLVEFASLPLVLARRVEVVRGAGSALYGANSIGGLINIIPPEADTLSARILAGVGSLGRWYTQFLHTNRWSRFGYVLAGNLVRSGPRFAYQDTGGVVRERVNSDLANSGILARVSFLRDFSLLAEYNVSRRGVPGPVSWPSDSARLNDSRTVLHLSHRLRMSDKAWWETKLFHHRLGRHYWNPDSFSWSNDTHRTTVSGISGKQVVHISQPLVIAGGVDLIHNALASTAIGSPYLLTGAGWLEASFGVGWLEVRPMARLDLSSAGQGRDTVLARSGHLVLSPKLSLASSPVSWLDLHASLGRSFRQPTFNEMYWPADQWTKGNPELRPEWATSIDFTSTVRLAPILTCRLGSWYSHMTDLIQWQPDSNFVYMPVNLDTATIKGVEAEVETEFRYGGARATGTYMLARSAGKDLLYRPRLSLGLHGWAGWGPVRLLGGVRYTGRRYTNAANTDSLPGFLLLDLGGTVSPRMGLVRVALRFGVRNLFDRQYQVMKDYLVPGRTFYGELELEI